MGKWQEAANAASIARQGYPLNPDQYTTGFDDMNASEWIWPCLNAQTKPIIFG